jgi:hypothetical protein
MKMRWSAVLLAVLFGAAAVQAADFWQKKKYPEWTQKEVHKMLSNSPWAQPVAIPLSGGMSRGGGGGRGGRGGGNLPTAIDASDSMDTGGGGRRSPGGRGGGSEGGGPPPTMEVTLVWQTALPVKQAVARARFGDEVEKSAEAQKMLGREETSYVVGIRGLPAFALRGDPAPLKDKFVLRIKGQPPIQAENISGERDGNRINLFVLFPKGRNGGHVITLEDRDVEVFIPLERIEVKRKFRLKDMVYDGRLEL